MTKYIVRDDGVGWFVKSGTLTRLSCCDCGLVHDIVLVAAGKYIGIAARRNKRATAGRRRNRKAPEGR